VVRPAVVGPLCGEEFAILIEGRTLSEVRDITERLRSRMVALRFEATGDDLTVTCSFGAGEWQAGFAIDRLLKIADVALYRSKDGGRNRVVVADAGMPIPAEARPGSVIRARQRA
jgi:diguanylate cyclase (GGDEF)-like protein